MRHTPNDTAPDASRASRRSAGREHPNRSIAAAATIADALANCPTLPRASRERDALWLAVESSVCTRGVVYVVPLGSATAVPVDREYATDELLAAMSWLLGHEDAARQMRPLELFIRLRGEATRGRLGSARRAQADALHGLTGVPAGCPLGFLPLDADEAV